MFHESDLSETEVERFSRQIIVPGIGIEGQRSLRDAKILVVGCGGLGCPVIMYLATCGVLNIGIVDHDKIEIHNLQRQVLYKESDINKYKVEVSENIIKEMNRLVNVSAYRLRVDLTNVTDILKQYDIIIDCTDNIETRYCLSDSCKVLKKDFICASVLRWEGHLYVLPFDGPCYRCLYPVMKKNTTSCDESGIIGPICGIFGSLICLELIKLMTEKKSTKMIHYNGYTNLYHNIKLRENRCITCMDKKSQQDINRISDSSCPDVIYNELTVPEVTWSEVLNRRSEIVILDVRSNIHFRMFRIKDSLNYPIKDLERYITEISQYKNIAITCKRGLTSKKAVELLGRYNIKAVSIKGGIDEYKNQYLVN